ncbi:MAG: hypothetical protein ACFFC0_03000, partial [Promethearchaeota archaeon]
MHWEYSEVKSSSQSVGYQVESASESIYALTAWVQTASNATIIWDRIEFYLSDSADGRIDVNAEGSTWWKARYEYDNQYITSDLTANLNDSKLLVWNSISSYWNYNETMTEVQRLGYHIASASESKYGLTAFTQTVGDTSIIWDRIEFYDSTVIDARIDVTTEGSTRWRARFDYDNQEISSDLTAELNGSKYLTWNGIASSWEHNETMDFVQLVGYQVEAASEGTYGLTAWTQTALDTTIIWDRIEFYQSDVVDGRIDVGTEGSTWWRARYDYDDQEITGGLTAELNGSKPLMWNSISSVWNHNETRSIVELVGYEVMSASESTFGLSTFVQTANNQAIIWDRIRILTTTATDGRIDYGATTTVNVTAELEYDGVLLVSGDILYMNNTAMTWDIDHFYLIVGPLMTVDMVSFYVNSSNANEDQHDITSVYLDSKSDTVIWDRVLVLLLETDDPRIDVDAACVGHATLNYEFDGTPVTDGSVTINDISATYSGSNGIWDFSETRSTVQSFTYDDVSVLNNENGITIVNQNAQSAEQIWDQLRVISYTVTDDRCNIDSVQTITAIVIYQYDGLLLTELKGTVYLNNTAMVWDSVEFKWNQTRSSSSVVRYAFVVTSITDSLYGLSAFDATTPPAIIWDALNVTVTISDHRINLDETASIHTSAAYAYDGATYDGTLNLNNTQFSYSTVQKQGYTVASATGDDSYGITAIRKNEAVYCIWDSLTIDMTDPIDQRINTNTNASGIVVTATYDYDGSQYDGTLALNNTQFIYLTAQRQGYNVTGALGDDAYGITLISSNDETYCIWDSLTIAITDPVDQRIAVNENASGIAVSAVYDYDSMPFDGTFTLNDTNFAYSTVGKRGYTVLSVEGDTHGITAMSTNDNTFCIWDRLQILISADSATPYNGVLVNFTMMVTFEYDSAPCTSYELVIARNATYWQTFTNSNKSLFVDTGADVTYDYNASVLKSETLHGITIFTTNTQRVVWSAVPNVAPTNDAGPELTNADDDDNMYARFKFYTVVSNISDADGYWDIQYATLTLYDDSRTQQIWIIQYAVSTDTFSVQSGTGHIELAPWSFALVEGNDVSITWAIKVDWDHSDLTDVDVRQYVTDGTASDEDFYEVDWDIETRLDVTSQILDDGSGTADRGPFDGNFAFSGTIVYLGSSLNPLSNETDVWISSADYGINIGPWSDLTLESGSFDVTCYADDALGLDTYTAIVVPEGGGAGGTDLLQGTIQDTYIADQVQVQSYSVADDRINIDDSVGINATLTYDYDDSPVIDGTVTINGIFANHMESGIWMATVIESTVTANTYNLVDFAGGAHGLNLVDQNGQSQIVIWDQITVRGYSVLDDWVNIDDLVDINVTIEYEYDDVPVTDGTVTINGVIAAKLASGVWGITESEPAVTSRIYNTVACTDNAVGISSVDQNSQAQLVVWDQVVVRNYVVADNHVNVDDTVEVNVIIEYEYNDSPVTTGTVTVNGITASHSGDGVWTFENVESAVVQRVYDLVACTANAYGISSVNQNLQSQDVIWDRVIVVSYLSDDDRIDVGLVADCHVTLQYEYDSAPVSDGNVIINGVTASYSGAGGVWDFGETKNPAQSFTYNLVSVSGNLHDIVATNQNDKSLQQIWDSLTISIANPTDQRINVNENASGIVATAIYDYDSGAFDGVLLLNDTTYQYSSVGRRGYKVASVSGDTYGITAISVNAETYCIWDSVTVTITVDDSRIDIGANASIHVDAHYDYDGTSYDGILTLNGTRYDYDTVGEHAYTVESASGDTLGITVISKNDVKSVIWDRLRVTGYTVTDSRCDVGTTQAITATVIYEYDEVLFTGSRGSIYLNGSAMTWDSFEYRWTQDRASSSVRRYVFIVTSITDSYHGLTAFYTNGPPIIIWDSLNITMTINDDRINIDESASIQASAIYSYDGASYDGTLNLNNTQLSYPTAQRQGYEVSSASGDDIHGITVIGMNDEVYCIWDSLTISITGPADQRININENASGIVATAVYDYDGSEYDGILVLNNTDFEYGTAQKQGYTVTSAGGDDSFGIYVISQNDQTYCIWDSLTISITGPADQRININENASGIVATAIHDYDSTPFDGYLLLNDTVFDQSIVGRYGYSVESASDGSHGISTIRQNDATYCIFDRLSITISVDDATPFNGHQANFSLTVVYEYDSMGCTTYQIGIHRNATHWNSFTDANKSMFVDTHSDVVYLYNASVVALETQYGITAFVTNTQQVTWSVAPNNVPENLSAPVLTNADNTLYAKHQFYLITSNVSDMDGYSDIQYVELTMYDNARTQLIWRVRYTVSGATFSVEDGSDYIMLAAWSAATTSATEIGIVWALKVDWDHMDLADVDVRQFVTDGSDTDEDFYEVDWDVETRLDYVSAPILSDDRGDISTTDLWISTTVVYYGTSDVFPLANETDVWITHDVSGEWTADVDA